jgi:general secretion pathway protein A
MQEKFGTDKFERKKCSFFKKQGWRFMPFAQKDPLPDPRLLVARQVEEVARLIDMAKEGDMVSLITSGVGMGKSALCKFLADALPEGDETATVFLHGPTIETPEQLVRTILERLELEPRAEDLAEEFEQFYRWQERYHDLSLVLIVDEFPDINPKTLEVVRALADLRGIAWVLNGQKAALLRFLQHNAPSLLHRRRFTLDLQPMNAAEAQELVSLRICWAKGDFTRLTPEPFTLDAINQIHRVSKGIPRDILKLAGDATYFAIQNNLGRITPLVVSKVLRRKREPRKILMKKREPKVQAKSQQRPEHIQKRSFWGLFFKKK